MISHLGVYRRSLVTQLGGLRVGLEGSQDYDLALRATDATTPDRIRHIPAVLYHWRQSAEAASFSETLHDRCVSAARRAIRDHLDRRGYPDATIAPAPLIPFFSHVTYAVPEPAPLVSAIIPTRDRADLLRRTCDGILHETDYASVEVIVVDNGSQEAPALALLQSLAEDPRVKIISYPGPFNYSAMNNAAARIARGEVIALLNNDLEVIDPGWLREMVGHALRREVGAVGAKLLYPDGRVQHAGVVMGPNGSMDHLLRFAGGDDHGYCGQLALTRALSAVTGACLVLRRAVFEEVGGLDEQLAVSSTTSISACACAITDIASSGRRPRNCSTSRARPADRTWRAKSRRVPFASGRSCSTGGAASSISIPIKIRTFGSTPILRRSQAPPEGQSPGAGIRPGPGRGATGPV